MSAVLLVEDEQHLAVGLQFNLEAEGYEVEIAPDGETALALLARSPNRFDAVVLDVMLPGKDGFEVASELRQAGRFQSGTESACQLWLAKVSERPRGSAGAKSPSLHPRPWWE
jgi:CheY-like chemotaxis protein